MCRENQLCIPGICHSGIEQPDDATGQQRVHFRVELVDNQPFAMIQRVDYRISQREVFDRTSDSFTRNGKVTVFVALPSSSYCWCELMTVLSTLRMSRFRSLQTGQTPQYAFSWTDHRSGLSPFPKSARRCCQEQSWCWPTIP